MSIKSAIDKLTGKSSKNIKDAISKMELGGESGKVFTVNATTTGAFPNFGLDSFF